MANPYCMGTLYWQLNDCWPVTSWSSIDYTGNWKALHYTVKKCFEKYHVSVMDTGGNFSVCVVSDDVISKKASLKIAAINFSGKVLWSDSIEITIPGSASMIGYSVGLNKIKSLCDPVQTVIKVQLVKGNQMLAQNLYYFKKPKDLLLAKTNVDATVRSIENSNGTLELSSKNLAKNIYLDTRSHAVKFSENYFDLLPGERRTIQFQSALSEDEVRKQLIIRSVSDTY
jgi:beta-mannosidase